MGDEMLARLRELERAVRPLEPGSARRRQLRKAAVARGEQFLRKVKTARAFHEGDEASGLMVAPIGERGISIEQALDLIDECVVRPGGLPASGGHLAYIPGSAVYHSALADYLAAVTNKYAGISFTGPGPVRMEQMLVRWTADLVGYPAGAGGHLASGGSIATLAALATARDAHRLKGADLPSCVAYLTTQAHHCIEKALRLAGLAEVQLRYVEMDERYRMRPEALAQAIAADRGEGRKPWIVIAAAGTTDTGAVDPLDAIGVIAKREQCWYHVDAAYGGYFLLTQHGRTLLKGIERSDSTVLDPHKGLFIPFGVGIVLVRDVRPLAETHSYTGHYMQDALQDQHEISPADLSPELSKHFRALRMWLPLVLEGTRPFAAALEEKLLLARYFRERVGRLGFETGPEPDLSIVTFRWAPPGVTLERANQLNQAIVDGIRRDGRVFLSSTMLDGRFTIRLAVLNFRTHRASIDLALRVLEEQIAALSD
ncbi:MAG TPA: aminotransferase class V-fold PLP-dependent enzyme [Gemmatimonadales bacterium]|nr:aminotransferase class V-fold PLP-dependent enzyme [Gemmatimonadales bacterium]